MASPSTLVPKSTAFEKAFLTYIHTLNEKKKLRKLKFLESCSAVISTSSNPAEMIMKTISDSEAKHSQRLSTKILRKSMTPLVEALKAYYGVIDTICQIDPFPTAIIWGSIKVVVDGLDRYLDLFNKIKDELLQLRYQLLKLTLHEQLWGDSEEMQDWLCRTYISVFKFWYTVDKECERCAGNSLARAVVPFGTKKLQSIIGDLTRDVREVEKLAPLVEGARSERERFRAGQERSEAVNERQEQAVFRQEASKDRQRTFYNDIRSWLQPHTLNAQNNRRHQQNLDSCYGTTCDWLIESQEFQSWLVSTTADTSVLWLYAGPGSGKSTLCSHAIENAKCVPNQATIFQFFYFDQQCVALQIFQNLAEQLLEQFWLQSNAIPAELIAAAQRNTADMTAIKELIHILVRNLDSVYIFLDGLDEEAMVSRWKEASKILDFVFELVASHPGKLRLWCSSQDRFLIRARFQGFPYIDAKECICRAVNAYLLDYITNIEDIDLDDETQEWVIKEVTARADGYFLWANLMMRYIADMPCKDDLIEYIEDEVPRDLDEYYRRILDQYREAPKDREYACKTFSLLTYARRPLNLEEIVEAIGIVSVKNKDKFDPSTIYSTKIQKLFAPLIERHEDANDSSKSTYRLFHSTVKDYLLKNPTALQATTLNATQRNIISEQVIADACLLYLSQNKYATQLIKCTAEPELCNWITKSGEDVASHHLLTYAAKYWDKHLDRVIETPELHDRVQSFLLSSNFITLLQLQSLFVDSHFSMYTMHGQSTRKKYLKRVLPQWFSRHRTISDQEANSGDKFSRDYREFVSEWRYYLHCPTCSSDCAILFSHEAEIDRCIWGALSSNNFLASTSGRYSTFRLSVTDSDSSVTDPDTRIVERVSKDGRELMHMKIHDRSSSDATRSILYESWRSDGIKMFGYNMKELTMPLPGTSEDKGLEAGTKSTLQARSSIIFSDDLRAIAVDNMVFVRNSDGAYEALEKLSWPTAGSDLRYEEVAIRDDILVLTSRQKPRSTPVDEGTFGLKAPSVSGTRSSSMSSGSLKSVSRPTTPSRNSTASNGSDSDSSSEAESVQSGSLHLSTSLSGSSSEYETSDDEDDSIYESWSEGSTIFNGKLLDDNDSSSDEDRHSQVSEEDTGTDSENSDSDNLHILGRFEDMLGELDDDGRGVHLEDDDRNDSDNGSDSDGPGIAHWRSVEEKCNRGRITIIDLGAKDPKQIFTYAYDLPVNLYASPPVVHPTKSLVVWPLCGGDILFVDFSGKTYFSRKALPSTQKTRHVFMKVQFSPCGQYLHIASLEAQTTPIVGNRSQRKKHKNRSRSRPLTLSLFLTTHRLSENKTARSPPRLIHSCKARIGSFSGLSIAALPITLTWRPDNLYFTWSSNVLKLWKLDLFPPSLVRDDRVLGTRNIPVSGLGDINTPLNNASVWRPKESILLPYSARGRKIYYFPPESVVASGTAGQRGLVLIGGQFNDSSANMVNNDTGQQQEMQCHTQLLQRQENDPVGIWLDEEKDLGGWIEGDRMAETGGPLRNGALSRKLERFDAEDDCDIEPYII